MATVMVEIRPKARVAATSPEPHVAPGPAAAEVEVVDDLDAYLEHAMCSCSASDDNPY